MDDDLKNSCPSCSQLYHIQLTSSEVKGNLPLFLPCGHTMCENCIVNIMKCLEPIECNICFRDADVKITDNNELIQNKLKLHQKFPVNVRMVGELTMNLIKSDMKAPDATQKKVEEDTFIDLKTLLENDATQGMCAECNVTTSKMCKICGTNLCNSCFNKTHNKSVVFKKHELQSIDVNVLPSTCKLHIGKPLDYYCKDCKKSACTDCMMLGGQKACRNHDSVSLQDVNETYLEDVTGISPQVDETFRRLTKTAVDIGSLLNDYETDTGSIKELSETFTNVEQHFSKLFSIIQTRKDEIKSEILNSVLSEKRSLRKARSDVVNSIEKANKVLKTIKIAIETKNIKQINLPVLLEEAKQVTNAPWFLNQILTETSKEPLKVTVNEDICTLIPDYVHLEGIVKSEYKLFSTSELGADVEVPPAPTTVVYAPEYARKSKPETEKENFPGSVSSLSSDYNGISSRTCIITPNNHQQRTTSGYHRQLLREGSQELFYISHVVNPNNFFVQRASSQDVVKDMAREFCHAIRWPFLTAFDIKKGGTYVGFNFDDDMWQRCRVLNVDTTHYRSLFQVFFFDFGSTQIVDCSCIRNLPPSRTQLLPLAMNCSLFNCIPKMSDWTTEDSILIRKIIEDKQVVINIHRRIPISPMDFKYECDVTTFENGISLAHALMFHNRAKKRNPKLKNLAFRSLKDNLNLHGHNEKYFKNKTELVYIVSIDSLNKFFVRKQHLEKVYVKLSEDLEQEYRASVENVYLPEVGMVCAVNLDKYPSVALAGRWARGVVVELPGRSTVRVSLPDVGLLVLVDWTALRYLHPKFSTISALATECKLAGIKPCDSQWSMGSVGFLQKYYGRLLELRVQHKRYQGSFGVILYYKPADGKVVCINSEMINHKFAISYGVNMFNKTPVEEQVLTNKLPLEIPKLSAPSTSKQTILKSKINKRMPEKVNDGDLREKDKGTLRLEVKILNCQSPSLIYVSFVHEEESFKDLYEKIQNEYSNKNNENRSKEDWQVGDRCVTLCIKSQTWRRAVIMELEKDNAKVFYSDFALIETVPKSALIELTSDLGEFSDAAYKCHLSGIMPPVLGEEWPSITKDWLKDFIDEYKRFCITKKSNFKDKSMPIQLWVYHTDQGGALEPNTSYWLCLNDKIVERGLCVPDRTQVVSCEHNTEDAGDTLSWRPMPMAPLNTGNVAEDIDVNSPSSFLEDADNNRLPREGREFNVIYVTDWLPPEPLLYTEFTGRPTHVDAEGLIYLHDVRQQETLEFIRNTLDAAFKVPDPEANHNEWTVGELCVALFYLDNRLYRGRVIEVDRENSSCKIHYIDYGNEEPCKFENMRKSIPLHKIPVQAHKCILNRVRPLREQWDVETLDYIHHTIVEKQCYVKVTGEPINGAIYPIDIQNDKLLLNDYLVECSLAVYTDGSKARVTKYAHQDSSQDSSDES